jgi:amidophosphoribosyltransferase
MSDPLKHECAVALLRLRKPAEYFRRKYGTSLYGFEKLALLLEKQHNRGQDGAGIAGVRFDPEPGEPSFFIEKSVAATPLADLLEKLAPKLNSGDPVYSDELYLGHLRYSTFGRHELSACHPFVRESPCLNRTLLLAGNFNLTDTRDIFKLLVDTGHHPASKADGYLILQLMAHCLEKEKSYQPPEDFELAEVLRKTARHFDGAYTLCGMTGDGTAFALRDPHAIRPGFFYFDDEVAVVASERPAIQAAFNRSTAEVQELPPGRAVIIRRDGRIEFADCLEPGEKRSCVFERIYFSRPNDADIHHERKELGHKLTPGILQAVDNDFDNTFFSYIPNSAQICFHGMLEKLCDIALRSGKQVRFGQVAIKDAKFRTFIADAACRKDFYMHVYDVTYGLVRPGADTLVVLDDSIVRGNTMRNAILPILDRLGPRRIVVGSSAPPIKYPDCYGIDMATLDELVAFNAATDVLKERGEMDFLFECYERAKAELAAGGPCTNCLKPVYDRVGDAALIEAIAARLRPEGMNAELTVVFQSCEALRRCCPGHTGDWYFTGDYPTPGGFRVVNQALVNHIENCNERAY